jgi:bifunctional DNA-binding transcriptional regulator/antitoxin component of YhaV-PrlF toxin-antitoxin module
MEKIGIENKAYKLGRILIPKKIRISLGLNPDTPVAMMVTSEGLLIQALQYKVVKKEADFK